jgi:hypothetical protein
LAMALIVWRTSCRGMGKKKGEGVLDSCTGLDRS